MANLTEKFKNDPFMPLRHTAEHILQGAMEVLYPGIKRVMGPPIEEGFYYDFDLDQSISEEAFEKIESEMAKIVEADMPMVLSEVSVEEARKVFADNQYKLDILDEIKARGEKVTLYAMGNKGDKYYYVDLCAGPHVKSTGEVKAFKLLSVAGAYYKGDEHNKMLQRIYGTAFESKESLENYLNMLEEAKKRDHRKIGKEQELFMFHETAPGSPYWLEKGLIMLNELIDFWRVEHKARDYHEIASPLVNKKHLWEISGHWDHYKDDMFVADMGENEVYGIKPMNCPNAMIVFGSRTRSYKDLPLRLSDTDTLHRYERSGTLNGLLRVRSFRQDDSHNFITEDQIEDEYKRIFEIAELFYGIFGLDFTYRLGTRPEGFLGDIETWNNAESILKKVLESSGRPYVVLEGDGAFYGPKIDILMKDAIGRDWQMGTLQLDFQLPRRFSLKYVDKDGTEKSPVVIHRVIYGSLERFLGIVIEHFAGAFPVWLSPVQVAVIPVSGKSVEYGQKVTGELKKAGLRVELMDRDDTMQAKIRDAQNLKIPYMMILGDREEQAGTVSVRLRSGENMQAIDLAEAVSKIKGIYLTKSLQLW